ncbi:MAG: haloacid dehalogenase [Fimbriimonadales bacterium]
MSHNWEAIVTDLKDQAQAMHEAREAGLVKCRHLIQTSAKCIRHVHRHQFEEAAKLLDQAKATAKEAREALEPFGALYYAGYLHDAEKEMVEAAAVLAIVHDEPYPSAKGLQVGVMAYLNGMGEAASEVRRYCLDEMRHGDLDKAEKILGHMETIYDDLITFDFSDAMTGGLRRTCDALRAVIERTRSDLTQTVSQHELVRELRASRRG